MKDAITEMKKYIILILIGVFSFWLLNNLSIVSEIFSTIYRVLLPFLLGGIIAFILNIPMKQIEKFLEKRIINKKGVIRFISIILSLLLFLVIILFIALLLIPELIENIKLLISNIPGIIDKIEKFILDLLDKYPDIQIQIKDLFSGRDNITDIVSNILNYLVNGAVGFISSLISSFITIFTAIIFSIYMLSKKEYLIRGCKKVLYALFNKERAKKIIEIGKMTNTTFSKFISGQCLEAVILGCLMFVAFSIFRFPYALIISVLTAVTALIPLFGAMIAMIVGAFLIAINNPIQVIVYIIVFLIVQQIEGNLIYPKVVGKSVGLSPLWTLLAITVGGNLFGILGMLIGLPLASVIYSIIKSCVNNKLKEKDIQII